MAGLTTEYRLGEQEEDDEEGEEGEEEEKEEEEKEEVKPVSHPPLIILKPTARPKVMSGNILDRSIQPAKTMEEMREARLKMFVKP